MIGRKRKRSSNRRVMRRSKRRKARENELPRMKNVWRLRVDGDEYVIE